MGKKKGKGRADKKALPNPKKDKMVKVPFKVKGIDMEVKNANL